MTSSDTAAPPVPGPPPASGADQPGVLRAAGHRFTVLRAKVRVALWTETCAVLALALVGYAALTFAVDRTLRLETPVRAVLLAALAIWAARTTWQRLLRPLAVPLGDDEMALAVERQAPALRESLISSMQFERAITEGSRAPESRQLMRAVVADVQQRLPQLPFETALDGRRMGRFVGLLSAGLAAFALWGAVDLGSLKLWALRNLALSSVEWPRYTRLQFLDGQDGALRLPQGDPLTVRVALQGPVPDQVFLTSEYAAGERTVEPMSRTGDGEYTLTIDTLLEDAVLSAAGGDGVSEPLRVVIVERPRIEDVRVEVVFPDYMEKEPEVVPPTEGELRLLRGSVLRVSGRSHKPIDQAFALLADERQDLERDASGHAFAGELRPRAAGILVLDVIDRDQLGAGAPPKLLLRLVDDKPPTIDFKLRGISSLVTPQVRIPGELKVVDDFGLRAVAAQIRVVDDAPAPRDPDAADGTQPPEVPFEGMPAAFGAQLAAGAARFESTATVDIRPLNPAENDDDPQNRTRPGMLLSLRFVATDTYGPGDPHEALGETFVFRVVTREKLVDELRRRQVEQRMEVQRIRDDEQQALLELRETLSPKASDPRAAQARLQFKALAARQQSLGRRVGFAADLYQRILWEYENNRIWEPHKVREYEGLTSVPLASLSAEPFPTTAHAVATFADTGDEELRAVAVEGYTRILARLDAIIEVMEQVETLAALIEQLRGVIKVEDDAIGEVERRLRAAGESVFGPPGGTDPDKDK
ncbi:MAG: hypothetical protein AB7O97_12025 [Planctomycetota bacterium]